MNLNLKQKRANYKTTFDFGPEKMDFTFSHANNRQGGTVPYEHIPLHWKYVARKRWRAKYQSAVYLLIGILFSTGMIDNAPSSPKALNSAMIFLSLMCVAAAVSYGLNRLLYPFTGLTVIPGKNEIRIIHDSQHEAIAAEILKRRREAMRSKLAKIDPLNAPGVESRKFRRLREEDIISEDEYTQALARLADAKSGDVTALPQAGQKKLH